MRWSSNKPKYGETRVKARFLLFPMCIDDEWRWLELARWQQYYLRDDEWTNISWVDPEGW